MIDELILPILALAGLACLSNTHAGLWISLASGFLMDPIRKVSKGQPIWMTGVVAAFVVATCVGHWLRGEASHGPSLRRRLPGVGIAVGAGALWVLIEAVRGFVLTGSTTVALIGVVAYATPLLACLLGFACLRTPDDFERFSKGYVVGTACMLAAALLPRLGVRSELLDQVGPGLRIHAGSRSIDAQGGLFRGLELAGWHAVAALSLLFVVGTAARRRLSLWLVAPTALLLGYGLLLTARRKYAVQFVLFLALWAALGWLHRRSRQASAWVALLVLVVAALFVSADTARSAAERRAADPSLRRLRSVGDDGGRVRYLAMTALGDIYARNGFLGAGAGTASQGAQYFGANNTQIVGYAAEGGLGKVLGELGVPGLVLLAWLGLALARVALSAASRGETEHPGAPDLATGVAAFLASNVAVFVIAHQVFGDPFVLVTLGLISGGLLRLAEGTNDAVGDATEVVGASGERA